MKEYKTALTISKASRGSEVTFALSGGLLAESIESFAENLRQAEKDGAKAVLLDCLDLTLVDSRGIGILVEWYRHFGTNDIRFQLLNVNGAVLRSFQLTNLTSLFDLAPQPENSAAELRRQKKALWDCHDYIEQIIGALGEGVVGVGSAGEILFVNPSAEKIIGWKEDELIGKSFLTDVDFLEAGQKDHGDSHVSIKRVACGESKVYRTEVIFSRKNGAKVPAQIVATSILRDNIPAGAIIGISDLSDRENYSQNLQATYRRYEDLVKSTGDMVCTIDLKGKITFASDAMLKALGYSFKEIVNKSIYILLHEGFHDSANAYGKMRLKGISAAPLQCEMKRKDGTIFPADIIGNPIYGSFGDIEGLQAIALDVSDRKRTEMALKESEKRLRIICESSPDAIVFYRSEDDGVEYANPASAMLTEYSLDEFYNSRPVPQFYHPDETEIVFHNIGLAMSGKPVPTREARVVTKSGKVKWVESNEIGLIDETGNVFGFVSIMRDITERKNADRVMREALMRFEAVIEHSPLVATQSFDRDGYVRTWNSTSQMLYGFSAAEAVGKKMSDLILEEEQGKLFDNLLSSIWRTGHKPPACEWVLRTKSGEMKWVYSTAYPIYFDGQVAEVFCMDVDITERKKAEMALAASEERFHSLYNNAQVGLFRTSVREDKIVECNKRFAQMFDYENTSELSRKFVPRQHYVDPAEYDRLMKEIFQKGKVENYEGRFTRKDGSIFWARLTASLVQDDRYIEGVCVDITAGKRALEDLRESEDRYRRLLSAVTNYTFTLDATKSWEGARHSEGCLAVLGYTPAELHADHEITLKMLHPDDRDMVLDCFKRIMAGEKLAPFAFRIIHRNGSVRWLRLTVSSCLDINGQLLSYDGLVEDITENKKMEEDLRQSQKMESIGRLAGGIAHDFNNILTGILGNLSLAEMDSPPAVKGLLSEAEKAGQRAAGLVRQLLAFSRKSPIVMNPMDLMALAEEVTGLARETFDKRISFSVRQEHGLHPVMGDSDQLHQVVLNLCVNARDSLKEAIQLGYCEHPQISIYMRNITIDEDYCRCNSQAIAGTYVELSVSDTGMGMTADVRKHIFDPFYTTKDLAGGTGLGLASVYGTVKQHNGWISVYSEPGQGATFKVYLPAAVNDKAVAEPKQSDEFPGGQETILLVDDEEMIRVLGNTILTRLGYNVILAKDGQDGFDAFMKNQAEIHVVILDISMPFLSGPEVLAKIRQVAPRTKVILSSGYSDNRFDDHTPAEQKPSAFVMKPYRPTDLARVLRNVLDGGGDPTVSQG